jgi:competence protein ComEC
VLPALRALGVDELDLVIASHADTDHIEGLTGVLSEMPVQRLVIGHPAADSEVFEVLIDVAEQRGVPVTEVRRGEVLHVGDARLDILNPPMQPFAESNTNSVAFVLSAYGTLALFLGDVPSEVEGVLAVPDVDVMMAAHHGSRFSTSNALLRAAQPERVVLSYGRNSYGHPHPDVLSRLRAHGAAVWHTHRRGALRFPLEPR